MTPAAIVDIVLIAVLAISLILGLARGLIHTLLGVVIFVVALMAGGWIANTVTEPVTDYLMPYIEEMVVQKVAGSLVDPEAVASVAENERLGDFGGMIGEMIDNAVTSGMATLSEALSGILRTVVYAVVFLLSVLVLTWLLRLITSPLRLVDKVPVLGMVNRLGGGALGLILGVLICFLIAALVKLTHLIDPADTTLYRFFAAHTPATLLALLR